MDLVELMDFWLNIYNLLPNYLHPSQIITTFAPTHQPCVEGETGAVFHRSLLFIYSSYSFSSFLLRDSYSIRYAVQGITYPLPFLNITK